MLLTLFYSLSDTQTASTGHVTTGNQGVRCSQHLKSNRLPLNRVECDPSSFCQGRKDLYHEGNRRFQLGNGGMAGFGKRPCPGGTIVQGPRFVTLNRVRALGLDALPVTRGTSPGE